MENLDLLVRGVAMQSSSVGVPGTGLGFSRSIQGLELLWVGFIATLVLVVMSVTRGVSVMTWGWSKSGSHVRVRVQSFSSLADVGAIVTAGGMFSAEIVHHSSSPDSCSEDADESPVSEHSEMVFYFDEKGACLTTTTTKHTSRLPPPPVKVTRQAVPELLLLEPVPTPGSVPRRQGIHWNMNAADFLFPVVTPVVYNTPSLPSRVVLSTSPYEFDPLLKLRIRDAVVSNGSYQSLPTSGPIQSSGAVTTLKNDVVRVWDCDTRTVTKSVHLERGRGVATAFDVNWESQVAAIARENSALSIANLDSGAYKQCYQSPQPIVQAIHLSSPNLLFTGASMNPGSAVSLYDLRSSNQELAVALPAAVTIYNIQSRGNELLVQDELNSIATHDLRVLRSSPLSRKATDVVSLESKWWDMETVSSEEDDVDEDDFFDCLPPEQASGASFNMSRSFARAVSFNFSSTKA